MSQPNIEIAKNCYAAFRRGEIPAILSALTDDVEWITPGKVNPTSGNRKGPAQVANFFEVVGNTWDFTAFEPREFVASGDTVVALGSYAAFARSTKKPTASEWVMVWKFRDGKVSYFREFTDTEALAAALVA